MADIVMLKRNDLQPYIYAKAILHTNTAIDLTGATIVFSMRNLDTSSLTLSRVSAGVTLTASTSGEFQYQWQAGNTATTGTYVAEFEITPATGGKFTLPVNRDLRVIIVADEDST